jgi:hypothetical protein
MIAAVTCKTVTDVNALLTIDEANADEAYERVLPDAKAVDESDLTVVNLDVMGVIVTTMGVAKKLPEMAEDLAKLPQFPADALQKLPDLILGLYSAQTRYTFATTPVAQLPELSDKGETWRNILLTEAKSLVARNHLNGDLLKELTGVHGYKNVATDLAGLARIYKSSWPSIEQHTGLKLTDIQDVDKLALRLTGAVAQREQSPERVAEVTDIRLRMFTLLLRTYDEIRRGIQYLRWHEEDADTIAPSLYSGRVAASSGKKAAADAKTQGATVPLTPMVPQPAANATAAKIPVGLPGSEPLTN